MLWMVETVGPLTFARHTCATLATLLIHARVGWFSNTQPTPKQIEQLGSIMPLWLADAGNRHQLPDWIAKAYGASLPYHLLDCPSEKTARIDRISDLAGVRSR
jgi:hypothetical protein